ncbi:uncharacterized protein LOC125742480 isoform X2 [Brienomyrus brachyistius]|uniref:uncharacterized protein LOC125742480 isoform X2 n=1 Tax=Brienomyrus brachyistius TaxID=42636 RepID=UPI0020B293CD|nr:uncharacterized protein LOC125742480 isoform X2 [Brienomyrus brachyistius]XP_048870490.1 uncharacterized protein LOC125742480 isoform X2 [Brienomyrus brachyistius]XP_048870491.1 uncharacterized protein LOC125742480 isoform X2 [Brienomyrus brachyistius]
MDVTEMSFALPAVVFTLLAIIVVNTIFRKTSAPDSPSQAKDAAARGEQKQSADPKSEPEVGVNESRAVHRTGDEKSADGLKIVGGKTMGGEEQTVEKAVAPVPTASVVEDVGVAGQQRRTEFVNIQFPSCQRGLQPSIKECSSKPVSEVCVPKSVPGPQPTAVKMVSSGSVQDTETRKPTDANKTTSDLRRGFVSDPTVEKGPGHMQAPVPDPELVPEREVALAMLEEKLAQYSPEDEEDEDLVAAGVESEEDLPLKYALGKLRSSQLEEMMTKEELEEERRIEFTTDFTSL